LSLGDDFIEASLRRQSLTEIWRSDRSFSRLRHKQAELTGACAKCAFAADCGAGCTAIAVSATGSLGCNPYCIRSLEIEDILGDLAESS
jgi:radical SAM protein with 4Fe4S-binding SPASM domain